MKAYIAQHLTQDLTHKRSGSLAFRSDQHTKRVSQRRLVAPVLMLATASILSACQSTPSASTSVVDVSRYSSLDSTSATGADVSKVAEVRTRMAAEYIRDNNLDAAKRELERAFSADKRYAPAYDMMGILLQKEGSKLNLDRADAFFRKAIEMDASFMQARNNYGVYLSQMGRHDDAIKQFEIAGAALGYEGRVGALENLGLTALKENNTDLAMTAFIRTLDADRNNLIAHLELVDLLIDKKQFNQAQNLYQELVALMGSDAERVPRILLQGIQLAHIQNNAYQQEDLSRKLLSNFPLSQEAKQLKRWIRNPEATWK